MKYLGTILAGAALMLTGGPAMAQAANIDSVDITGLHCATFIDPTVRRYTCEVSFTATAPPVTIRWYDNGVPARNDDDKTRHSNTCLIGTRMRIDVVVADRSGASDRATALAAC